MPNEPQRLSSVQADLARHALAALVVSHANNRRYLTGFTGSAGLLVVMPDTAYLLADSRYYEQAAREAPHVVLERAGYETLPRLADVLARHDARKVGFEAGAVTVQQLKEMREKVPGVEWMATTGIVERHRTIKAPDEIDAIRRAIDISDRAMAHAWEVVRPGMTEADLAWALEVYMREHGADGMAFDIIVGAGENGALPHHRAGQRVIHAGEPIVVDMGARLGGYHSDITRTFCIGEARDPDYARVYDIVDAANRAAIAGARPGMTGKEVDALGRDVIVAAGFGEQFGHSLGHGVGLDVHEGPRVGFLSADAKLEAGMVFTVEPGIYLPGRFGVRIEDIVVLREDGAEVLTRAPKPSSLVPA